MWCIFTFCRFDHALLVNSVYSKSVVTKLGVHNLAEPQVILKIKVVPNAPMEAHMGSKKQFFISALDGGGWRTSSSGYFAHRKEPKTSGPHIVFGGFKDIKNLFPPPTGFEI